MENGERGLRKLFIIVVSGILLSYGEPDNLAEMSISYVPAHDNWIRHPAFLTYSYTGRFEVRAPWEGRAGR